MSGFMFGLQATYTAKWQYLNKRQHQFKTKKLANTYNISIPSGCSLHSYSKILSHFSISTNWVGHTIRLLYLQWHILVIT